MAKHLLLPISLALGMALLAPGLAAAADYGSCKCCYDEPATLAARCRAWRSEAVHCFAICGCVGVGEEGPPAPAPPASDPEAPAARFGESWRRLVGGTYSLGPIPGVRPVTDDDPARRDGPRPKDLVRAARVEPFWMMSTEVTNAMYAACVAAGECPAAHGEDGSCWLVDAEGWRQGPLPAALRADDLPVTCVGWSEARTFCAAVGGRLPAEIEWEWAARSQGRAQAYVWGDEPAGCDRAVFHDAAPGCGRGEPWPVCSKGAGDSAQGICDLAGNVEEWLEDCWHETYTDAPMRGAWASECFSSDRVLRGGSWLLVEEHLRATARNHSTPAYPKSSVGFRCVRDLR